MIKHNHTKFWVVYKLQSTVLIKIQKEFSKFSISIFTVKILTPKNCYTFKTKKWIDAKLEI